MKKVKTFKQYFALLLSLALIISAIGINVMDVFASNDPYEINYEYVTIKDMAEANVSELPIVK